MLVVLFTLDIDTASFCHTVIDKIDPSNFMYNKSNVIFSNLVFSIKLLYLILLQYTLKKLL